MKVAARFLRAACAVVILVAALAVHELALPDGASACLCERGEPAGIGDLGDRADIVVLIGTVTSNGVENNRGHSHVDMRVERVFKGDLPPVVRALSGGGGDCTMSLPEGLRLILAATYVDDVLRPGLCGYHADPATADGRAMVAAAEQAYGIGVLLEPPPAGADLPTLATPEANAALPLVLASVGLAAAMLFGAVAFVARRRREGTTR